MDAGPVPCQVDCFLRELDYAVLNFRREVLNSVGLEVPPASASGTSAVESILIDCGEVS